MNKNMNSDQRQPPPHSAKFLRQRKFLTVLPVLVLPFLLFLGGYFGLVGDVQAEPNGTKKQQGFNTELPSAAPAKDSNWNKLKYYEQADRDSSKLKAMLKNDPYRKMELTGMAHGKADTVLGSLEAKEDDRFHPQGYDPYPKEASNDPHERRAYAKIAALNDEMARAEKRERAKEQEQAAGTRSRIRKGSPDKVAADLTELSPDIQKLETMMQTMQGGDGEDPELQQLNGLLEKVLDVQHPQRLEQKLQQQSIEHKRQVFPVETTSEDMISVLEARSDWNALLKDRLPDSTAASVRELFDRNRFYSLEQTAETPVPTATAIAAIVPQAQTVLSGATLQLRLLHELFINGVRIPKQSAVTGTVSLKNNRLQVVITSISYQQYVLPVQLTVYCKDGMPGLPLDASALDAAGKQTVSGTMQGVDIGSMDPSIGAQAASAGIQAAKTLINKKAKLVKMTVPAGYTVLLVDANQSDR